MTLTETSGTWTHTTMNTYGTWTINNQTTCDTDATCYDVSFAPNTTNITPLTDNTVIQLVTTITPSGGSAIETDTLTFNILASVTKRTISIEESSVDITEGGTATITLTADGNPVNSIDVSYKPTETSTGTAYLKNDSDGNGSGVARTAEDLIFRNTAQSGSPEKWTAVIEIPTNIIDGMDKANGVIEVVLEPVASDADYSVATSPAGADRITINVKDFDVPEISIEDAPNAILPNAAQFTLTSDIQPRTALTIRYKPNNTTGNFLEVATNGAANMDRSVPTAITFAPPPGGATSPITGILTVPTITDDNNDAGVISVELLGDDPTNTDPTYKIAGSDNTKTVKVFKYPVVELSIDDDTLTATEGDQDITITVTASENPMRSIPITFTPTDTTGTYLADDLLGNGHNDPRAEDLTFTNTAQSGSPEVWQATFDIDTKADDNTDAADGEIKVTLNAPTGDLAGYSIKADPADHVDITIIDATKPIITIGTADPVFHHGNINNNIYEFRHDLVLVSNIEPHAALNVKYSLTETGTDFLEIIKSQ